MRKNVILDCSKLTLDELKVFLEHSQVYGENISCRVSLDLLLGDYILGKLKELNYKILVDLERKAQNFSLDTIIKTLIDNHIDAINVHLNDGYELLTKVIKSAKEVFQEYQEEYQKYENDFSYSAEAYKHFLTELLKKRPLFLGIIDGDLDANKMPLIETISLAKLCQNEGYDGIICNLANMQVIKQACGEEFITISTHPQSEEEYTFVVPSLVNNQDLTHKK